MFCNLISTRVQPRTCCSHHIGATDGQPERRKKCVLKEPLRVISFRVVDWSTALPCTTSFAHPAKRASALASALRMVEAGLVFSFHERSRRNANKSQSRIYKGLITPAPVPVRLPQRQCHFRVSGLFSVLLFSVSRRAPCGEAASHSHLAAYWLGSTAL
jgi:hypothetical protein